MTLRFGTDGVRGVANTELTPELVLALGRAAARTFRPAERVVIGRDTRRSGPLIEAALTAGFASEGVRVERLGVIPTPGVAWVAATEGLPGAVISASHNPARDNGIKFFAAGGRKLDDVTEERLEAELDALLGRGPGETVPAGAAIGRIDDRPDERQGYVDALASSCDGLDGLSVVLDCANGAASWVAPEVFRRLGAVVHAMNDAPDGDNINLDCGSTHPEGLRAAVASSGADAGLAFDGDADRVLAVDAASELVDGDQIIAICALDLRERGLLTNDSVVVTVMTNLGFRLAMAERGIRLVDTPVGDRHVLEALERDGLSLGGEQSGHVIFRHRATTGDGLLTGILLLDVVKRSGRPLAELAAAAMTRLPQVLVNVKVERTDDDVLAVVDKDVAAVQAELGERGRVLIRPSGTEPVVRVMVEAPTEQQARDAADRLAAALRSAGH